MPLSNENAKFVENGVANLNKEVNAALKKAGVQKPASQIKAVPDGGKIGLRDTQISY